MPLFKFFSVTLLLVTGCSTFSLQDEPRIPVSWLAGEKIGALLTSPFVINDRKDLRRVMGAQWYAEVNIAGNQPSDHILLGNCEDYLLLATEKRQTLREYEMPAFLELSVMCRSVAVLLNAQESRQSNIPNHFINQDLPEKFPWAVALQTSVTETKKKSLEGAGKYWGDLNNVTYRPISEGKVRYLSQSGTQTIEEIGRGDFNHDGLEDVLVTSRDAVTGGSYFNLRLFALSVDRKGQWFLVQAFEY